MVKIHTEIYGHGQPLVLIHGWSMHSGIWRQFARQLAQSFQVICVDLPGHGRSEAVKPYELKQLSKALLAAIPMQSFHLLGWSLGATVAIDMASRYPDRVSALTILAGNPCFVQNGEWAGVAAAVLQSFAGNLQLSCQTTLMRFLALQVNGLSNGKALLKALKQAVLECEPPTVEVLQGGLEILRSVDLRSALQAMDCPLLYIQGDKDTLIPLSNSEQIKQLKPTAEIHLLHNAGHVPFLSHQTEVFDIVSRFCSHHVSG